MLQPVFQNMRPGQSGVIGELEVGRKRLSTEERIDVLRGLLLPRTGPTAPSEVAAVGILRRYDCGDIPAFPSTRIIWLAT